jgi:hypothetical protein
VAVLDLAIESPTGCTKQLISVAASSVPAADWMRPAGMKPMRLEEHALPMGALVFPLRRRQGPGHPQAHVGRLVALGASRTSVEMA